MGAQIADFGFDAAVSTIYRIVESTVHIVHTASFETYYGTLSTVESIIAKSSTKIHPRLAALINTIYYHGINRQNFIWFALIAWPNSTADDSGVECTCSGLVWSFDIA